jgi:hypothetical protein
MLAQICVASSLPVNQMVWSPVQRWPKVAPFWTWSFKVCVCVCVGNAGSVVLREEVSLLETTLSTSSAVWAKYQKQSVHE